ncbi:MAG TPA: Gfo/Idh/MocA family oxidoreductase [Candidatus Nanopelagicales bacterium]|nr:Gfo/Idh/MocA family oxidoreductase [Candidatus Nanopelagicales bacterium]
MTIRVGVIGTGNIGTAHAISLAREVSGSSVSAVFDVDTDRAQTLARDLDTRALPSAQALIEDDDVDAVVIASPDGLHAEQALACLAVNKPVMLEKPLAPTLEEAKQVLDAEVATGQRSIMLGFMRRFDPGYVSLKSALDAGEVGHALIVHNMHRNAFAPYGVNSAMNIANSAVHEIDINRWLLGEEYASVQVVTGRSGPDVPEGQHDPMLITFTTASGVLVPIELFMTAHYGYQVICQVVGSDGVLDMGDGTFITRFATGVRGQDIPEQWLGRFGDAYRAELQAWIDSIRGLSGPAGASTWDGYVAALSSLAAVQALTSNGAVGIELPDRPALYS